MNVQRTAYMSGVGDDWYNRNKKDLGSATSDDPVTHIYDAMKFNIPMEQILEVGCSNGWRLKKIKDADTGIDSGGIQCFGIDPSADAIADANKMYPGHFHVGVATDLPWGDGVFDLVIMGFCMWALDPADWLSAAGEADRVLRDNGLLIIHDRFSSRPLKRAYPNRDDVFGYSYDWKRLWMGHPCYHEVAEALGVYPGSTSIEGAVGLQKRLKDRILFIHEPPEATK